MWSVSAILKMGFPTEANSPRSMYFSNTVPEMGANTWHFLSWSATCNFSMSTVPIWAFRLLVEVWSEDCCASNCRCNTCT